MTYLHKNFTKVNYELTLSRKQLQDYCSTANFPTVTTGKNWKGELVTFCYCPICERESSERNKRRKKLNKPPIDFKPNTSWQSSDVIIHMVEFHKLPLVEICKWIFPPEKDLDSGETIDITQEEYLESLIVMCELNDVRTTNTKKDHNSYKG